MKKEDEIVQTWVTLHLNNNSEAESKDTFSLFFGVDWDDVEEQTNVEENIEVFSGFRVQREVGRGGVGLIESAEQKSMVRFVAIKTVHNPDFQPSLIREAKITGSLSHPNIIPVYDVIKGGDGTVGISMPLIHGKPWNIRRVEAPKPTLEEELDILIRVGLAVAYAHDRGVLHNDLKLENVMVGDHGSIILMDWGCATSTKKYTMSHIPITPSHTITKPFGTPCYMPPELARGNGAQIDTWSDVYQLGGMLYEILENRPPRSGTDIKKVIQKGVFGEIDPMTSTSSYLRALCMDALAPDPEHRIRDVREFVDRVRSYFSLQASEQLSLHAQRAYEACVREVKGSIQSDRSILLELQKTIYTFEQAEQVGAAGSQKGGIERTRVLLIETALELGDLSLAHVHLDCLPMQSHQDLRLRLKKIEAERREEERVGRRNRLALVILSICLVFGLVAGNIVVREQRQFAEQKLKEIAELSGIQLQQELIEREKLLWPAVPERASNMRIWIQEAQELVSSLPNHEAHLKALERERGGENFQDPELRWEYQTLKNLISGLKSLQGDVIPIVAERLELASALHAQSIEAYESEWKEAIASIAASPLYGGLVITPQLGLLPLEINAQGLWEFSHVLSGAIPKKNRDGTWEITEETSLVFVLLPKGEFLMGASANSGNDNFDPRAADIESPVHAVSLDAFFLSKYELTQAQWLRVQTKNPSAYLPGQEQGGFVVSLTHPVEHMTWQEAVQTLERLDLILPTEAQWEYANRAGSQSVYWGGNTIAQMRGRLNISDRLARERGSPSSWKFEEELDDGHIVHAPVGLFTPNRFGLHDTSGNVWEWCLDRFGSYTLPTRKGDGMRMVQTREERYIFRGGGFRASSVHARSADRYSIYAQDYSAYDVGIRPARMLTSE